MYIIKRACRLDTLNYDAFYAKLFSLLKSKSLSWLIANL